MVSKVYPTYKEKLLENAVEGFLLAFYYLFDECKYFETKKKLYKLLSIIGKMTDRPSRFNKFRQYIIEEFEADSRFNHIVCRSG